MHSLWLAFLLLLATASQGDASPPHRSGRNFLMELKYLMQRAANTCTHAGQIICNANCNVVIECMSDGHGGFQEVWLEECDSSSRCSAENAACVTGGSACGAASQGYINCHDTGYFPDPYDCTLYHLCLAENIQSTQITCESGYAYNPLTTECSFLTTDAICTDGPVPACKSRGQSGALDYNPSIYYVCTASSDGILRPQLYRCHNGEVYDPQIPGCAESSSPTNPTSSPSTSPTSPTSSTSTSSTPPTSSTESTPGTPSDDPPVAGAPCWPALERVADPLDCTAFYECSEHLVWLHVGCTFGFYYNPVHGRCELGLC